ncbi:MAG: type I DNA topoisomerase [Prevotella sp.]|nr:type I DNA topoisomerase [Bacteroides sp.]MCM1366659.1 type I DNA topoisomerase [Prevotella sp.]MCM1437326.1 type I DNA topoisomerase [Prevotella sp.]
MMKNLVIVESPAKAKTIEKFLGKDYKVMSSYGHIRDLQNKEFDIDGKKPFEPDYEISPDKEHLVKQLKSAVKQADMIWLASDEDREGEAIAWHLYEVLGLNPDNSRRIVFHEITKPAILAAISNPRTIDIDRVNAQQARRVLDRIVGFELSPVLWKKIKPALSAGRVQSVAVRLICEREEEIVNFKSETFYRVNAIFNIDGKCVKAELDRRLNSKSEAEKFLQDCHKAIFSVENVTQRPTKRTPAPPFTTSTLQQEAARKLGLPVNRTMMLAQKLYEAGLITYMRTDSLNLSTLAVGEIAKKVKEAYGDDYLHKRNYHTKTKGAQEAHEAIRPTYISNTEIDGTSQEKALYQLIWRRAVASQMADAELLKTHVDINISTRSEKLVLTGEQIVFDGFLALYPSAEDRMESTILPPVKAGMMLEADEITATERFTQAPARYTEASLVKKMEELGIGRPSTYAPTISTIQSRDYVVKGEKEGVKRDYTLLTLSNDEVTQQILSENTGSDKGKLVPTDVGMIVNKFLTQYFPDILDYNFTARIEEKFDEIAEGKLPWQSEISDFYGNFHPNIESINSMRLEHKVGERLLGNEPQTGKPVSVKIGRFGPVVQIGDASDEEKPRFASLQKGQSINAITLEEALKLFELPRSLGEYQEKEVQANVGRFGPYVKFGSSFVSIPKELTPQTITLQQAIELIEAKKEADAKKVIKTYEEAPEIQILNGRYGPYIAIKENGKKAKNYKIPKGNQPEDLKLADVRQIIEQQDAAPAKPRAKRK